VGVRRRKDDVSSRGKGEGLVLGQGGEGEEEAEEEGEEGGGGASRRALYLMRGGHDDGGGRWSFSSHLQVQLLWQARL